MTLSQDRAGKGVAIPRTDAELFDHICARANIRPAISWDTIAEELGLKVSDLLDWFLAYRGKSGKQIASRPDRSPALIATNPGGGHYSMHADAQRFANWRRSTAAAHKARNGH